MCEGCNCVCDFCENFACCYCSNCGCDSCSRKCCGCAVCICSICFGLFFIYILLAIILAFSSKNRQNDDNQEEDLYKCQSIKFKPRNIKCNINNILIIDLSLGEDKEYDFHAFKISLYEYYDIKAVYNKYPFLVDYREGYVFASDKLRVSFSVKPGQYSLEYQDNLCGEVIYENILIPPLQSSCENEEIESDSQIIVQETTIPEENEDQIIEQEITIPVGSSIPEFVIIMDISGSMEGVVNNYIKTIIPDFLTNLNYQSKSITLITFSDGSNEYNYTIDQFRSSNIRAYGTTKVSGAFNNLKTYFSKFSRKKSLRILTISDGAIFDKENAMTIINEIYSTYYGLFPINSKCVRVGNIEPDTKIFSNILRLIYPSTKAEILNVEKSESNSEISEKITKMFENDGITNILWITSDVKNIRENPYTDYTDEVPFINDGRVFIILKKRDDFNTLYVKDTYGNILRTIEVKYSEGKKEWTGNNDYSNGLVQKYIYNKLNGSSQAILENTKIKKFFEDIEASSDTKKFCDKINKVDDTDLSKLSDKELQDFINEIIKD